MKPKWQRARFLPPTPSPDPFWVLVAPPEPHEFPPLNDEGTGFDKDQRVAGMWYKTNVMSPNRGFCMWAPANAVELLAEFSMEDVEIDHRFVATQARSDG